MSKKRVVKAWAVVWTNEAMEPYGVPEKERIISVEPREDIEYRIGNRKHGRPKIRMADTHAIFKRKIEAEAFREGNKDFASVPCTITYELPEN